MLEKTKPVNKKKVAVSIFFTAFAFGLNIVGISPVLGVINEKYQQYGTSVIQLLQTIQYLLIMVGSLMIGWLTTKISKKKIVLSGLLIIGICGIMPFFSENFWILVLSRILIGFGFGITGPMNTAIAAELIPEEERAGYMGLHVVGMGIGTMVGSMLGGMLAGWSYRNYYLVYLIPFIAMAGVQALLVETPPTKTEKASDMKLNKMVYLISFASFAHTLFINAYSTNIGIYIAENISNNPGLAGMVTAIGSAAHTISKWYAFLGSLMEPAAKNAPRINALLQQVCCTTIGFTIRTSSNPSKCSSINLTACNTRSASWCCFTTTEYDTLCF